VEPGFADWRLPLPSFDPLPVSSPPPSLGGHTEGYPDTFAQLFKDFYEYVAAGKLSARRTFPTFETGHEELILCDAHSRQLS